MAFSSSFALGKLSELLDVKAPDITVGPWDVIQSIESVHQVPLAPILVPVSREYITDGNGAYYDAPNEPLRIVVIPTAICPELTLVHELGHLLDHQLLETPGSYASENSPLLENWKRRIETSEAFQTLNATSTFIEQGESEVVVELPDGKFYTFEFNELNIRMVQYLLNPCELFARSYAQYIALRSQHNVLRYGLNVQQTALSRAVIPRQWENEDFEPIAEAFDALFHQQGWNL